MKHLYLTPLDSPSLSIDSQEKSEPVGIVPQLSISTTSTDANTSKIVFPKKFQRVSGKFWFHICNEFEGGEKLKNTLLCHYINSGSKSTAKS